jgi:hypothetical protein
MNTSGTLTQDENSSPTFTHDLLASAVPVVTINGLTYYEFLLDINQTGTDPLLSLSSLSLCVSDTGNQTISATATTCAGAGSAGAVDLIYDLDAGTNNSVELNYLFNSGSGSGDLFVYIPTSTLVNSPGISFTFSPVLEGRVRPLVSITTTTVSRSGQCGRSRRRHRFRTAARL